MVPKRYEPATGEGKEESETRNDTNTHTHTIGKILEEGHEEDGRARATGRLHGATVVCTRWCGTPCLHIKAHSTSHSGEGAGAR